MKKKQKTNRPRQTKLCMVVGAALIWSAAKRRPGAAPTLRECKEGYVRAALGMTTSLAEAARLLGITRRALYGLIERHKIPRRTRKLPTVQTYA